MFECTSGTATIAFFHHKATQLYGKAGFDEKDYRHYGPSPQSKETAIVMMADGCEAAVRSMRSSDPEALEALVRKIVSGIVAKGQLDDAPLTLREISAITDSFVDTLQGVFHPRVRYPTLEESPSLPEQATAGAIGAGAAGRPALPGAGEPPSAPRALAAAGTAEGAAGEAPDDGAGAELDDGAGAEAGKAGAREAPAPEDQDD